MQVSMSHTIRRVLPISVLLIASVSAAACGDNATYRRASGEMATSASSSPEAPATASRMEQAPLALSGTMTGESVPAADARASGAATSGAAEQPTITSPAMVIRSGSASVQVDSLEAAIAAVQRLAAALGGYVGNTSLFAGQSQVRSATLELKIPSARFDEALSGLNPLGTVESISSTAEDVGEEFVDITARVTNARRLEERLITLLATRTGKLEDVLAVERELSRVREEIERWEGRLRYLRSRVATSTLSVTVHEPAPLLGAAPGENVILDAFKGAWRNFVHFVAWCIASLGVLIPVAVLAVIGWLVWRRVRRG